MLYNDFLFYLLDEDGRSYYIDSAGNVKTSGVPMHVEVGPDGWKSTSVKWTRNTQGFGNFRAYTSQYKYVLEAAKILRSFMYQQGTEAKVFLMVLMLDKSFGGGWKYKKLFKSELDFSTAEDDTYSIAINAMEGGLVKLLKANENTQYDIPLFDNDEVLIRHDGIELETTVTFNFTDGVETPLSLYGINFLPSVSFLTEEGRAPDVTMKSQSLFNPIDEVEEFKEGSNWLAYNQSGEVKPIRFSGKLIATCVRNEISSAGALFRFRTSEMTVPEYNDYEVNPLTPMNTGETYTYEFDFTIPVKPLEKVYFQQVYTGVPTGAIDIITKFEPGSVLKAFTTGRKPATNINAFTPKVLGQKLIDLIAGPGYTFSSSILETEKRGLLVTSEDALRGFEKPYIKTSWNDFFNSYNVPCGLTWKIEGQTIYVNPKASAFGTTEVLDLGEAINEPVIGFADSHQFNTVSIGWPEMKIKDANGRFEFNSTVQWTSDIKRVVKELNLVSKYSASMYDQEFTRINYEGKTTTNTEIGPSNYFIDCEPNPILHESGFYQYYKIKRGGYASIEGLLYPDSAYNVGLSPIQCLYAHGDYLRAVFYFIQKSTLKFASTKGNRDFVTTTLTGVRRSEIEDVPIENFKPALFIPLELEVESEMPLETVSVMDQMPDETFTVSVFGLTLKGHPTNVEVQPADNAAQKTKLLLSSGNDILKLIRI